MTWGAIGGAAIGLVGSQLLSDDKNGGAGATQQQTTKDPWGPAQPWLLQNIARGQGLQNQLTAQPFSPHQQAAYGNQYALSDYMRRLAPSLLGQLGTQPLGYDQRNPRARPKAFDFAALAGAGAPGLGQTQLADVRVPPPVAAAPVAPPVDSGLGSFVQQAQNPFGERQAQMFGGTSGALGGNPALDSRGQALFGGGYGSFKYGQDAPQPGTKAYRDMQEFFAYGGADPYNLYGRGVSRTAGLIASGQDGGPGAGGIGAAGGAGAGSSAGGAGW